MNSVMEAMLVVVPLSAVVITIIALFGQRRLGKHRGVSREEFIRAFKNEGITLEIPAAVYDYYKSLVFSKHFSVSPDDDYEHVLSKGNDDVEDDAVFLMKKLGVNQPTRYTAQLSEAKIRTVRDMVRWLDCVRTKSDR
jgi:hypothetical protein